MIIKIFNFVFIEPEGARYGTLLRAPCQYREIVEELNTG
jgi:hypothetical protein